MSSFVLFCDGGSRGNPGPAASGYVIYQFGEELVFSNYDEFTKAKQKSTNKIVDGLYLGQKTNNVAEWQAVLLGLKNIIEIANSVDDDGLFADDKDNGSSIPGSISNPLNNKSKPKITVFLDSELVVRQATGRYKVKNEDLKICYQELKSLELKLGKVFYNHIYREFNKEADAEVNRILDGVK